MRQANYVALLTIISVMLLSTAISRYETWTAVSVDWSQPFGVDGVQMEDMRAEVEDKWGAPTGRGPEQFPSASNWILPDGSMRVAKFDNRGRASMLLGATLSQSDATIVQQSDSRDKVRTILGSPTKSSDNQDLFSAGRYDVLVIYYREPSTNTETVWTTGLQRAGKEPKKE